MPVKLSVSLQSLVRHYLSIKTLYILVSVKLIMLFLQDLSVPQRAR